MFSSLEVTKQELLSPSGSEKEDNEDMFGLDNDVVTVDVDDE
jgi:hypothetical protein